MKDMVRTLEIDELEHLFPLLLCSSPVEMLISSKKGNGQLVKRAGREGRSKDNLQDRKYEKFHLEACWKESDFIL